MSLANSPLPIGTELLTNEKIELSSIDRAKGTYIIGLQGTGKSNLLKNMMIEDYFAKRGFCLIDPHGDLVADILENSYLDPDNLVYLDPSNTEYPFGLNLFECKYHDDPIARTAAVNYIMSLFRKLWGDPSLGVQIHDILSHVAQVFVRSQLYTLVDVPLFLESDGFRRKVLHSVPLSPQSRLFWEQYDERPDKRSYIQSTLNKVRTFTDSDVLYPILGQSQSTVDVADIMENGKILLVRLPEGLLGEETVSLLGSIITGQILQAMLSRVRQNRQLRTPFALYCDEYQLFATEDFNRFFSEGRKFGIQTTVAHQWRGQLDSASREATSAVANRIVFRVSSSDAPEIRRWFSSPQKQTLAPVSLNPVEYIIRHGHFDPVVAEMGQFLNTLHHFKDQPAGRGGGQTGREINAMISDHRIQHTGVVFAAISRYWYQCMTNQFEHESEENVSALDQVTGTLISGLLVDFFNLHPEYGGGLRPKTKILISNLDYINLLVQEELDNFRWFMTDHLKEDSPLRNFYPLTRLIWLIGSCGRRLRLNPVREYPFDTKAYQLDEGEADLDVTTLPVGQAFMKFANGDDIYEACIQVPYQLMGIAPTKLKDVLAHARQHYTKYRDEVDQEIDERQRSDDHRQPIRLTRTS